MRKGKEILRLKHEVGLTNRQTGRSCNISHVTVSKYLRRAKKAGIRWPLPPDGDDGTLEALLEEATEPQREAKRPLPEMEEVHKALRRKGVTLQLLWEEYRREHQEGYGYTQFCGYYKAWKKRLNPSLRQRHKAGEKLFVDWAGQTMEVIDPSTGESRRAYLFVGTLGASNYTYVEGFEDTKLSSWITAHVHMFEYMGGVAKIIVPDNTKTAVSRACRYEPDLHPGYQKMAEYYGTAVIPARPRKPKDKTKVEAGVQHAERRIIGMLRHQTFFSFAELNRAILKALKELNERPFKKMEGSRATWFEELDKSELLRLPMVRYEPGEWRKGVVNIDYHVQVDWHNYSVPYRLVQQHVEICLTARTVEILYRGKRVAVHRRSSVKGGFTTDPAHRPKSHRKHLEWSPGRLIRWGQSIGPRCGDVVTRILESKPHPEQGYRSCLGIMRLGRAYGNERLEAACRRAVMLDVCSYRSIKSILKTKMDTQSMEKLCPPEAAKVHKNLRGGQYYQ